MTDSNRKKTTGKDKPSPKRRFRLAGPLVTLLILAALAAAGWLGYQGERRLAAHGERLDTLERGLESSVQKVLLPRLDVVQARLATLEDGDAVQTEALASLQKRMDATRLQISKLSDLVEGGQRRWQLLEVENLLLAANERLQLHRDPRGAKQALTLANTRLGTLDDPRLFPVRERVVDEIAALEALPDADTEGLALTLAELIDRVPNLPLASHVPDDYAGADAAEAGARLRERPWQHLLDSVSQALESMVTIRRTDAAHQPLMPPEREFFLYQNLLLKLENARLALFRRDTPSYRHALGTAHDWLNTYFDRTDPRVAGAMATLNDIRNVELAWEAPDISGSLTLLRDLLLREAGLPDDGQAADS